jgi:hypothetical protein
MHFFALLKRVGRKEAMTTYPVGSIGLLHGRPEAGEELGAAVDGASRGVVRSLGNVN